MRLIRHFAASIAVTAVCVCNINAQVMDQVPEQSLMVIKVSNLEATSGKLAKFSQDMGIAMMVPPLNDPLGSFLQQMGITNGVDKTGEMAFAFIDPAKTGVDEDESMVILFPVSDYKAFVENFPGAKTDAGVSEVTMPGNNQPGFIAAWGKYAAISPAAEVVKIKPAGVKVNGALSSKEVTSKDIVLFANIPALKTKLAPELKSGRESMLSEIDSELSKSPQLSKMSPVIKAAANQALNALDQFLIDAQSATVAVNFVDTGISTTVMAEFTPGSYIGGLVSGLLTTDKPLIAGLPDVKYIGYGGSVGDAKTMNKLVDDIVNPILKELVTADPALSASAQKYIAAMKTYGAAAKSMSFGMVAPTGNMGQEAIFQMLGVVEGDADTMKKSYGEMLTIQQDVMKSIGGEELAKMLTVETKPAVKTLNGVTFDVYSTEIKVDEKDPQAAQMKQGINMMYGPEGMNVYYGSTGKQLLIAMGANDETMTALVDSAKSGNPALGTADKLKAVDSQLPAKRAGVAYFAIDEFARTLGIYAAMFGAPIDVQLPPDLPPLGFSVGSDQSALRIDSFTPTDTLKSIVAAGMQAAMQMNQGRGGPGGM